MKLRNKFYQFYLETFFNENVEHYKQMDSRFIIINGQESIFDDFQNISYEISQNSSFLAKPKHKLHIYVG